MQPVNQLRIVAQMDFLEGYALLRIATGPGTASRAVRKDWYNQGLEALVLSQEPLTESGVHGMSSVVNYLQGTGYVLVRGHASAHQKAVSMCFCNRLHRFEMTTSVPFPMPHCSKRVTASIKRSTGKEESLKVRLQANELKSLWGAKALQQGGA